MIFLSLGSGLVYAIDLSGTIHYTDPSGNNYVVTTDSNGNFTIAGIPGTIDASGNFTLLNGTRGNVLYTPGVKSIDYQGTNYVVPAIPTVVPVATSSAVNLAGEIVYNGQKIKVDANGNMEFILSNGVKVPGVVRADGSYTFSNGTTGNLSRTPGVTSISVGGKTFPILSTIKGASDLTDEWLKMNPGVPDAWRHDGGVNNAQVAEWIRQNPNLAPEQIVAAMEKYKLLLGQVSAAMGKGNDINYVIGLANKVGITNQELSKKKIIDPLNIAKNSDNIWNAVSVGMLPQGVWYAFNYLNSGRNHPMAVYSQTDFDLAKKYMQEGYWGPTGTGDMPTEMKNAGLLNKDGKYTGPNYWKTSTGYSTGPNIAGKFDVKNEIVTVATTSNKSPLILSETTKIKINTWIAKNIIAKSTSMTSANYTKFVGNIVVKLNTAKLATPSTNVNKINIINYLTSELEKILNNIEDESFLDNLLK